MPFLDFTEIPQISFNYAGRSSGDFLAGWQRQITTEKAPDGSLTHVTFIDPDTGLQVTIHSRRFADFPAIDWFVELENRGAQDTPLLADILPLDISTPIPPQERLRLHYANGSSCRMDDFLPSTMDLLPNSQNSLAPFGGRRIDLETLSRSLPLWPSDFSDTIGLRSGLGLHIGAQCINAGLARWVPLFGGGVWNFTPYSTRSQIIGGFTFGCHIDHQDFPDDETTAIVNPNDVMAKGKTLLNDDFPTAEAQAAIAEWKSIRPFFLGDFYLLLPLTVSYHDWCAWQLHREDLQAGIAMFFRRHRSPFSSMEVELRCVDPDGRYDVSLSAGYPEAPHTRMSGRELARLSIAIAEAPGSLLLRYARIK